MMQKKRQKNGNQKRERKNEKTKEKKNGWNEKRKHNDVKDNGGKKEQNFAGGALKVTNERKWKSFRLKKLPVPTIKCDIHVFIKI